MMRGSVLGGCRCGVAANDVEGVEVSEEDGAGGRGEETAKEEEEKRAEQGCIEQWWEVERVARSRACKKRGERHQVGTEGFSRRGEGEQNDHLRTSKISSTLMALPISCLFAKTSKLAPIRRCQGKVRSIQQRRRTRKVKEEEKKTNLLLQQVVQLLLAVSYPRPVRRVDDPDYRVRLLEVVAPVRPQRGLSANVPWKVEEGNISLASEGSGNGRGEVQEYVQTFSVYPLCIIVRILNPKVGETSSTFSPSIALQIVVLPALSSPLHAGKS